MISHVKMLPMTLLAMLWIGSVQGQDDYHARYGHAVMRLSCDAASAAAFTRGLLQLHSFAWELSRDSFGEAAALDPDCAMAYWGIAMSYYDGLHEHPGAAEVASATTALARSRTASAGDARERAYVEAAAELFRGYPDVSRIDRDRNYSAAMRKIATTYPEEDEATIFYALSLISLARRGEDDALLMQAARLLEPLFDKLPDHPGVAHYLIHAYDDSGERQLGIDAARRYAGIAPLMTHAQHMPSHIFAGLGLWEESNASNATALEADPRYYHALMYLVYGDLQLGRWRLAEQRIERLRRFADAGQGGRREQRGLHSTTTWYLLETRDWEAAADAIAYSSAPLDMAETLYVRGLGAAQTGRLDDAAAAVRSLESLLDNLDPIDDEGLAVRISLIRIHILQIEALIAIATGRPGAAVARMQDAVALEDAPGVDRAPPDSGSGLPAREVFGELLLDLGRYDEAREQFELALARTPNRLHSMLGLARVAARQGDRELARRRYMQLLELLGDADPALPAVTEAQQYLAT